MIEEEKHCNLTSDSKTFLVAPDRLSLYHLQKKHERLQQQQWEKKNQLTDSGIATRTLNQINNKELVSNTSENDISRSSSSTSNPYSDNGSITSSTLTPSSLASSSPNIVPWTSTTQQQNHSPLVLIASVYIVYNINITFLLIV